MEIVKLAIPRLNFPIDVMQNFLYIMKSALSLRKSLVGHCLFGQSNSNKFST